MKVAMYYNKNLDKYVTVPYGKGMDNIVQAEEEVFSFTDYLEEGKQVMDHLHDITKNNIIVSQVIVDQVVLEDKFRKKLEDSRDISAQKSIELQKIETAKAAQQRIVAEGERDKAAEKVEQELAQVKALIAIETSLKKEETNKQLSKIKVETAELDAKALKVKKDAEAYANRKLVQAGLTPQERAEWEYKTRVDMMKALSGENGITLPTTVFQGESGGKSGQTGMLESILGAKILSGELGATK